MRDLVAINLESILAGGEARTTDLDYAWTLANCASDVEGRPCEVDHNEDGSYSVRFVPLALLDAATALRTGMFREEPAPGVVTWTSKPEQLPRRLPKPADHVVRDRQAGGPTAAPAPDQRQAERRVGADRRAPLTRSESFELVGVYEAVANDDDPEAPLMWRRLELRSVPSGLDAEDLERYGDALNDLMILERDLDVAAVFCMFNAEVFEAENAERLID